jgi:hypothetical protein
MPKNKKPKTTLVVIVGDTHTNSTRGLRPPEYTIKGGELCHAPRIVVEHLWEPWKRHWRDVAREKKRLSKQGPVEVIVVDNGDGVDRSFHDREGYELLTPDENEIIDLGEMVLEPVLDVADRWIFNRGTRAHEGGTSKLMELLARTMRDRHKLDILTNPETPNSVSQWWPRYEINGVDCLFGHRPVSGSRLYHTRRQAAARTATHYWNGYNVPRITNNSVSYEREKPPDVMFFGHLHYDADSGSDASNPIRVFYVASWQMPTSYIHGIGKGAIPNAVGSRWLWCCDGEYRCKPWLHRPPARKTIKL